MAFGFLKTDSRKRREFADRVIGVLEEAGRPGPWTYDAEAFAVVSATATFYLERTYAEYRSATGAHQSVLMDRFRTLPSAIPASREGLVACLRPMLRDRGWLELYAADHRRAFGSALEQELPHVLLSDHHAVTLVAHHVHSMATVTQRDLAAAGLTTEEAFAAAGVNLRALAPGFRELRRGLWVSVEEDDFDASRLLLPRARQLAVRGEPVALAANRNALFVTGDADEDGLSLLAEVAGKELSEDRSLAPVLLRFCGEWQPWIPGERSKTRPTFERWQLKATLDRYNRQKATLEALEQFVGEGASAHPLQHYFYGSLMARGAETMSFWFPTPTLLPRCDVLCLRAEPEGPIVSVRWGDAISHLGSLIQPIDGYPERWRADAFPSPAQLQALASVALR